MRCWLAASHAASLLVQGFKRGSVTESGILVVDPLFQDVPDSLALEPQTKAADDGARSDVVISGNILSANFPPPPASNAGSMQGRDAAAAAAELEAHRAEMRMEALMEVLLPCTCLRPCSACADCVHCSSIAGHDHEASSQPARRQQLRHYPSSRSAAYCWQLVTSMRRNIACGAWHLVRTCCSINHRRSLHHTHRQSVVAGSILDHHL